jgi:hypothetical protein
MATVDPQRLARYKAEMEAQTARKTERKTFTKTELLKPPKNVEVLIRILPGQEPGSLDKDYFVEVWQHFGVSTSGAFPVTCPRTLDADASCPACAKVRELYATKNPQDKITAQKMRAKPRYMMSVIPLQGFPAEVLNKIVLWPAPQMIRDRIQSLFNNPDYGDITHATEGYDCRLTVTGEGMQTNYILDPVKNPSPLDDDPSVVEFILQAQLPLYKQRFAATCDDLRKYMTGESKMLIQHVDPNEVVAPEIDNSDEDESVFTQVDAAPAPAPAPVTTTQSATVAVAAAPAPVAAPVAPAPVAVAAPPVAAPAKRAKFDVSAIKSQIAGIKPALK